MEVQRTAEKVSIILESTWIDVHHTENAGRNMNVAGTLVSFRKQMRTMSVDTRGKVIPNSCYQVAESLVELCPSVGWKVELVSSDLGYLAEIPKQNMESVTWFLLTVYCTMQEDRGKLRNNLWSKKEPEPDLWNLQPINIVKNLKDSLERTPVVGAEQVSWLNKSLVKKLGMWLMDLVEYLSRSQE